MTRIRPAVRIIDRDDKGIANTVIIGGIVYVRKQDRRKVHADQ